jgi:hypothetical protein
MELFAESISRTAGKTFIPAPIRDTVCEDRHNSFDLWGPRFRKTTSRRPFLASLSVPGVGTGNNGDLRALLNHVRFAPHPLSDAWC